MTDRFSRLGDLDVTAVRDWLSAIPLEEWPHQDRINPNCRHPCMVDASSHWFGVAEAMHPLIHGVMSEHFRGYSAAHPRLSMLVPGQRILPHRDPLPAGWVARVHVPICTNEDVEFSYADGLTIKMPVGAAYSFNPQFEHRVDNRGDTARVHLFFDVLGVVDDAPTLRAT